MPSRRFLNLQKARALARPDTACGNTKALGTAQLRETATESVEHINTATSPVHDANTTGNTTQTSVDLLHMAPINRRALSYGGVVRVLQEDAVKITMSRALFLATSTKGHLLLQNDQVHLPKNIDSSAALKLLEWVKSTTESIHITSLPMERNLAKALPLIHAADALGMTDYIKSTIRLHKSKIFNGIPTHDHLAVIEEGCTSTDDMFLRLVANRIAYLIRNGDLVAVADFKLLNAAIQEINAPWNARQVKAQEILIRQQKAKQARVAQKAIKMKQKKAKMEHEKNEVLRDALLLKLGSKIRALAKEELDLATALRNKGDRDVLKLWK